MSSDMAENLSPLHPQGGDAGNPPMVQPDSDPLHAEVSIHHQDPVVIVQPSACISHQPAAKPVPDYMCYSRFTTLWCICLGAAALHYSKATRKANAAGRRAEALKNSQTALTLNHVGFAVGFILTLLYVLNKVYLEKV